jgi:hypothetical protein
MSIDLTSLKAKAAVLAAKPTTYLVVAIASLVSFVLGAILL